MKSTIKRLCMLFLVASLLLGLIPSNVALAATKYSLSFTGKMKVVESAPGKYPEGTNLKPTLKKGKNGIYTLTLYEGTIVNVGIKKSHKQYIAEVTNSKSKLSIWDEGEGYLQIEGMVHSDEWKTETYSETVVLQMTNCQFFGPNGGTNTDYGKVYGPKLKLKVIVKKCPKELWEIREEEAIKEINASQYTTDFDKVRAVYDWITSHIVYDYTYKVHSWREALEQNKSVCQGYAELFNVLCGDIGMKSMLISGEADGMGGRAGHAWNAVKVDGKWYLADPTWDAAGIGNQTDYRWFLRSKAEFPKHYSSYSELKHFKISLSKESYVIPEATYQEIAKKMFENEKKRYEGIVKNAFQGYDVWIKEYALEDGVDINSFTQEDIAYYQDLYESICNVSTEGFWKWLWYDSEESYIEAVVEELKR